MTTTSDIPRSVCVDFDGTICDHAFPEIGALKHGAKGALTMFRELGYKIIISSCRTSHNYYDIFGGDPNEPTLNRRKVIEMINFLDSNEIPYDEIDDGSKGKVMADYYLDDKAVRVDGNWPAVAAFIYNDTLRRHGYSKRTCDSSR